MIEDEIEPDAVGVLVSDLIRRTSALTGVPVDDIVSRRRQIDAERARFAVMWAARQQTHKSFPQIGRAIGRHHSTVIYGIRRARELRSSNAAFRWVTDQLTGETA